MKQNYGVLRVVRVRLPANATTYLQDRYPSGWLPEEQLVHLLTHTSTTLGRALNNDIILMDPTVSREHARLDLDAGGANVAGFQAAVGGLAEKGLGEFRGEELLADALRAGEEIGVGEPPALDDALEGADEGVMPADPLPGHAIPPRE